MILYCPELLFLGVFLELQKFLPKHLEDLVDWDLFDCQLYTPYIAVHQNETDLFYRTAVRNLMKEINKYYHDNEKCELRKNNVAHVYSAIDSILGQTLVLNVGSCTTSLKTNKKRKQFYAQRSFIEMRIKEKVSKQIVLETKRNQKGGTIKLELKTVSTSKSRKNPQ